MDALKSGMQGIGNTINNTLQQAKDYVVPNQDNLSKTENHNEKISTVQEQSKNNNTYDNQAPLSLSAQEKVDLNKQINDPNYEGINKTTKYYQEHGHRQLVDDVPNKETPPVSDNTKAEKMKTQGQTEAHDALQK